jgi:hypothetical protein
MRDEKSKTHLKIPFAAREIDFSLLHSFQTGSGTHPASYPMGTGG